MQNSVEKNLKDFEALLEKCTILPTKIKTTLKLYLSCTK